MKNVILVDCKADELDDFKKGIEDETKEEWIIQSYISNGIRANLWKKMKRYIIYFYAPFKAFLKRKNYKNIIGWQQFYALIFCWFCMIFHVKKSFNVYIVNFTYKSKKGIIGKIYYKFMKKIVNSKYCDYIFVPSKQYIDYCEKELNVNKSKFVVLPFGVPDLYPKYKMYSIENNYAMAIGRSNRDFDWLIKNWNGIDYPLYIISDTYDVKDNLSSNIKLITDVSGEKQFEYFANCNIVILPIKDPNICSGDTVLLTGMCFEKNVIVTSPSTLAEMYIEDGGNGFLIDKNSGNLKELIKKILASHDTIGKKARESFIKNFSRYNMGINIGKKIIRNIK